MCIYVKYTKRDKQGKKVTSSNDLIKELGKLFDGGTIKPKEILDGGTIKLEKISEKREEKKELNARLDELLEPVVKGMKSEMMNPED